MDSSPDFALECSHRTKISCLSAIPNMILSCTVDFRFVYDNVADGYKMIGNAVPVRFATALALRSKRISNNDSPTSILNMEKQNCGAF